MRFGDSSGERLLDELLPRTESGDLTGLLCLIGPLTGLGLMLLLEGALPEFLLTLFL